MVIVTSQALSNVLTDDVALEVEHKINIFQSYLNELPQKALGLGIRIVLALLFFFVGVQIIKLLRAILKKSLKKANADIGVIQFLDSFTKAVLYLILIFFIASNFGLDATSIVAVIGSAGVAVGLALQGSLSNFAGGVLILLLRPFRVGDYIIEDNKKNEGTVIEIQLFYTKLLTVDDKIIILPNGTLANTSLTNVTATSIRRLDIPVSISYHADLKKAKEIALALVEAQESLRKDKEYSVFVNNLKDSYVELMVRFYVNNEDYWNTRANYLEALKLSFDESQIEIPYNQLDVNLKKAIE